MWRKAVERFSVIKTLQAIDSAHVVIALLDAQESCRGTGREACWGSPSIADAHW